MTLECFNDRSKAGVLLTLEYFNDRSKAGVLYGSSGIF